MLLVLVEVLRDCNRFNGVHIVTLLCFALPVGFVPFRGSALTRVLAEGFVRPDALLHVMATISPCATDIEHSISDGAAPFLGERDCRLVEVR